MDYSRKLKTRNGSLRPNCSNSTGGGGDDDYDGDCCNWPGSWARIRVTVLFPSCTGQTEIVGRAREGN